MFRLSTLLLFISILSFSNAQENQGEFDTLSVTRLGNDFTQLKVRHNDDTSEIIKYSNGIMASIRPENTGSYYRYYKDGSLMWKQEIYEGKANGEMRFFKPDGTHIGTLEFKNDSIIDTLFLHSNETFVFGQFTYTSVIHGGMRRPDGKSNVSRSNGGKMLTPMFAVQYGKTKEVQKYREFYTDRLGYFFFIAEHGNFGIFPGYQKLDGIRSDMGAPLGRDGGGVHTQWNITRPIQIDANFCYLSLHVHSTGYAP